MTAPSPLYRTLRELAANYHYEKHTSQVIRVGDPLRVGFFECEDGVCARVVEMLQADLDREPTYTRQQIWDAAAEAATGLCVVIDGKGWTSTDFALAVVDRLTTNG